MGWITFAVQAVLFAVNLIITYFINKEDEDEQKKASDFDDDSVPQVDQYSSVPWILGMNRMSAPNTLWVGGYNNAYRYRREKTNYFIFQSVEQKISGYQYYLSIDMAICLGPDVTLHEVYIDEARIWQGTATGDDSAATEHQIPHNQIFGGYNKGGGFLGQFRFWNGRFDPDFVAYTFTDQPAFQGKHYIKESDGSRVNFTPRTMLPRYNGIAHLLFDNCNIGESNRLRKAEFIVSRKTNDLGLANQPADVATGINPAEVLYQMLIDGWGGMDLDVADIDLPSLKAMGNTLTAENFYCHVKIPKKQKGSKIFQNIMDMVDGVAYQDSTDGKLKFKLIRDDYTIADLPVFDEEDIINVKQFSRTGWEETANEMRVQYRSLYADSDLIAIAQDPGGIANLGRIRSDLISMPFVYNPHLALEIAERELSQASVPLFSVEIEMNRMGFDLRPGDVFIFNWEDYGIQNMVLRIKDYEGGKLEDGTIVLKCVQDFFALNKVVFSDPPESMVEPAVPEVANVGHFQFVEMPRYLRQIFTEFSTKPIDYSRGIVVPIADKADDDNAGTSYDVYMGAKTGELDMRSILDLNYAPSMEVRLDTTRYSDIVPCHKFNGDFAAYDLTFQGSNLITPPPLHHDAIYVSEHGELMWLTTHNANQINQNPNTQVNLTFYRGILGSERTGLSAGDKIYHLTNENLDNVGILDNLASDGTVYAKFINHIGDNQQDETVVVERSMQLENLVNSPPRPIMEVNGSGIATQGAHENELLRLRRGREYTFRLSMADVNKFFMGMRSVSYPRSLPADIQSDGFTSWGFRAETLANGDFANNAIFTTNLPNNLKSSGVNLPLFNSNTYEWRITFNEAVGSSGWIAFDTYWLINRTGSTSGARISKQTFADIEIIA